MLEKSYLFIPGNRSDWIKKAIDSDADALIIDLEDSIPLDEKANTRKIVATTLEQLDLGSKLIYVRINDLRSAYWEEDLALVERYPQLGIMLPKAESKEDINKLGSDQMIIPLLETAKGVLFAYDISIASPNVERLAFGAVDYSLDLGISLTSTGEELLYPRSALVVASRAAGIASPIDTVYVDFKNENGLITETTRAKQLGLFAKLCIHPEQVKVVNHVLHPTDQEIQWANEVIEAFEAAESKGIAAVNVSGKMVDYPVYKQAQLIRKRAK